MKIKWLAFIIFSSVIVYFLHLPFGLEAPEYSILFPLFIVLFFGLYDQFKNELKLEAKTYNKKDLIGALMVILGFGVALSLSYFARLPIVMASAITGILGYVFIRAFEKEIYCGSFAGMIAIPLMSPVLLILIALFLPMVYLISKSIFSGFGGKLGTIAFVSSLAAISLYPDYVPMPALLIGLSLPYLILVSVSSILVLYGVKHKFKLSSVIVSAGFSLLASLILFQFANGGLYASLIFAVSFIIMTEEEHIRDISFFIISAVILSFLFSFTFGLFTGIGGKAGLQALISVVMTKAVIDTFYKTLRKSNTPAH